MCATKVESAAAPAERSLSEGGENICPVCHDPILMFAIGPCDHPICHRCSTRMRVLCEKTDCPICRDPSPQVAFVYDKQLFKNINLRNCIPNRKYKIFFEDEEVEDSYLDLLEFRCRLCKNRGAEKTFNLLQTHMRREHQLFACDLCVAHLKIFPYERKFYNRKNLATHRRIGDADDKSYKGHPLCEFCDARYFDKDELMKHLRKDHYFCHFCDQQGSNAYYDQYPDLMNHFSESHFLCTEGECGNPNTRFTHAFISDIDLKAHKAAEHNKNFTKAQSREARTLELDFQLPPRRQGLGRGGADNYSDGRSHQGSRGGDRHNRRRNYNQEDADLERALEASRELAKQPESRPPVAERVPDPVRDFPSLNGAPVSNTSSTNTSLAQPKSPEEDFPTLTSSHASDSGGRQASAHTKAYSTAMNPVPQSRPVAVRNESRPVPLGSVSAVSRVVRPNLAKNEEDFPSLGGGSRPASAASWLSKGVASTASSVASGKTLAISKAPSRPSSAVKAVPFRKPISDEKEFPSLGGGDRAKTNGVGNLFSESWSNVKGGASKKPPRTPRSERVDDDTFELPDSFYKSLSDPTENSNISVIKREEKPVVKAFSKPAPSNNSTKDFPGLPVREKSIQQPNSANEKKKKKNLKKTRDKQASQETNGLEDSNASLSDIALGLMRKPNASQEKKSVVSYTKKQTDWFDSPPAELTEKTTPQEQGQQKKGVQKDKVAGLANGISSCKLDNAFPSLHAMSTSVQIQPQQTVQQPPGFSLRTDKTRETAAVPTPPPGFTAAPATTSTRTTIGAGAPPGFSPNAEYIEPPEFKTRNRQLIADIRQALETVEDGFDNFRALSMAFRQGMMEASDYYDNVATLIGREEFGHIFPELLVLLPDISKQKQLWEIYQPTNSSVRKGKKGMKVNENPVKTSQCLICGQVTLTSDMEHHRLQHAGTSGLDDFPTLGDKPSGKGSVNGSWIQAK